MTITVEDLRTGAKVPVYIGADPPEPPTAPAAEVSKDDLSKSAAGDTTPTPDTKADGDDASKTGDESADKQSSDSVAPPRNEKGQFIPKARFDEVNERRKLAEKKLAELTAAEEAAKAANEKKYDFDAAEKEYMNLLLDGKLEEAGAKRREIRAAEQEDFRRAAAAEAQNATKATTVKDQIDAIAAQYEAEYPAFNPEHESFREDIMDDLQSLYGGYLQSGRFESAPKAFKAALDKTIKLHELKKATPDGAVAPEPPLRTARNRVEAIINQPPMIGKAGSGSSAHGDVAVKVSELTEAQTMALPEATRRRLRGDFYS